MPCIHQFGIIPQLDPDYDYQQYEPEKYDMVVVDDDLLESWYPEAAFLPTYFHQLTRPDFGLARYGITLIPPDSCEKLAFLLFDLPEFESEPCLQELFQLLQTAKKLDKFVLHYGV